MNKNYLRLMGSLFILSGVLCTNLNIYPYNIYLQSIGVIIWTYIGIVTSDRTLLINFIPQIPLFLIGYYIILSTY